MSFTWKVVNDTQWELTVRDGHYVVRQRFDKALFWLRGPGLEPYKRRLEQLLARRLGYID